MKTTKVRGLVLKEYEAGESDKRLLLLCKGQGRVMAYARGARKPRSKFMAAAQIFTYSDYVLAQGRGFFSVAQVEVIENFYDLRTDYDCLRAAYLITEACEKTLLEKTNCDELLKLVLKSLSHLAKKNFTPLQIICVFLARFFDFHGFRPHSTECAICNLPIGEMGEEIFWGAEGLLCKRHMLSGKNLSMSAIQAISHILNSEMAQAFQFTALENVQQEVLSAMKILWQFHFDREITWFMG
ncbi:MAG: DNA repair protein RecO [Defluviitaleaceae bacterium]|nr:DNA repair protein RecO [Defluviitaleaceae bacterium]